MFQFFHGCVLNWCHKHGGALLYMNICERKFTEMRPARRLTNFGRMIAIGLNSEIGCLKIEEYSPNLDAWNHLVTIPGNRAGFAQVSLDQNLIIIGGDSIFCQNMVCSPKPNL